MLRLKILIVLYNKLPLDSQTLNSFLQFKEQLSNYAELIIWDNSEIYLNNSQLNTLEQALYPLKFIYKANGLNTSLSRIYNKVIESITQDEFLVIFDHDSTINISYFTQLIKAIKDNPDINLFLPIVNGNNQIVSPANRWYFKGSYWKNEKYGILPSKRLTAINSGMAINGRYLVHKFIGYDEDLKFYETDNDFMYKYSIDNSKLFVINTHINHILSIYEESSIEEKIFRFNAAKEGCLIHWRKKNTIIYKRKININK